MGDTCRVSFTLVVIVRLPVRGIERFAEYEGHVLPLLAEFGGHLDRRLRSDDGLTEVHVVRFPSRESFESYRADPRRVEAAPLLAQSGASTEVLEVSDV